MDSLQPPAGGAALAQVFQVRRLLEPKAAALAAARITSGTLGELAGLLRREEELVCRSAAGNATALREVEQRFHHLVNLTSGNCVLAALAEALYGGCVAAADGEEAARRVVAEHRAILTALRLGDPDRARLTAESHLVEVEDRSGLGLAPLPR